MKNCTSKEQDEPQADAAPEGVAASDTTGETPLKMAVPAIAIAFLCGLAELTGSHLGDIGAVIVANPSLAIGATAIALVVASPPGKAMVAGILRRALHALERS